MFHSSSIKIKFHYLRSLCRIKIRTTCSQSTTATAAAAKPANAFPAPGWQTAGPKKFDQCWIANLSSLYTTPPTLQPLPEFSNLPCVNQFAAPSRTFSRTLWFGAWRGSACVSESAADHGSEAEDSNWWLHTVHHLLRVDQLTIKPIKIGWTS